ncbi:MAG: hypothetical protein OXC46_11370 [Thaumarchaeota archaeon]|nr:hypothetical protein [Nitrososphaerota archaeon]
MKATGALVKKYQKENFDKLGKSCFICGKKSSLVVHHLYYLKSDKKYSQFANGVHGKVLYQRHLARCIAKNPTRFELLCQGCHYAVEIHLRWRPKKLDNLMIVVGKTRMAKKAGIAH